MNELDRKILAILVLEQAEWLSVIEFRAELYVGVRNIRT